MGSPNIVELETQCLNSINNETKKIHNNMIVIHNVRKSRKAKAKRWIKNRFHILNWIEDYNLHFAFNDLIAGLTLGLTIIPESIACARLAGLPSHHGLYSSFIGSFVYLIFGTVAKVLIGPTSLVALVTVQFTMGKPIQFAFILTFLAGVVELLMGLLRLGFIFEFISMPVIKAFSTATAVLVIESQIKVILGIKYLVPGFVNSIQNLIYKLEEARAGDAVMGTCSLVFLILLKQLDRIHFDEMKPSGRYLNVIVNYISLSKNGFLVIICAVASYIWVSNSPENEEPPFRLSTDVVPGMPNFSFPSFTVEANNRTYTFLDICSELGMGIFVIPFVSLLTNISIAKALTPKGLVNASQELFTLGLCNIMGSGVQSMPTCGAFSRAAISQTSGIKTSIAGIYSSFVVIFAMSLLTPYFTYIPESTLAAILMVAIVTLIDFKIPIRLWRESKRDFFTWLLCFSACVVFGVEVGLFFGIAVTAAYLLYLWARPKIRVKIGEINGMQYVHVTPNHGMYFPGIDHLRERTLKACIEAKFRIPVVIDCHNITGLDYTAAQGISKLAVELEDENRSQALVLFKLNVKFQKLIDNLNNLVFCETEEKLKEILTQESLRNGFISLKDHVRASIDLGYKLNTLEEITDE
ncbi:sodium-independent sulfate anion transporter-like [Condylostylus longicornis]|uniref:sodium-independent sulfate anion transporter-like n=1 Tax=Condylostylus longicornis TaxID=2530218 RepID=UPI00244DE474|nr:sodium-independent sulfate anion transporter-like [Condylostylus longicornis]